jgi:myo-inositol-1(or 4)-monophosphatase
MDLQYSKNIMDKVKDLVLEVGDFIVEQRSGLDFEQIRAKGQNDFVTEVDLASEKKLVAGLSDIFPEAGFITEENTVAASDGDYKWIIDPIDGTTNFIYGLPCYSISIALVNADVLMLGVVYELNRKELFTAIKGQGAYLNGEEIGVAGQTELQDSLIATGFPYNKKSPWFKPWCEQIIGLASGTRGLRRWGSAAVDLAYLASGRLDIYVENGLNPWDAAAGILLVEEAGGVCLNFDGSKNPLFNRQMIASNEELAEQVVETFKDSDFLKIVNGPTG